MNTTQMKFTTCIGGIVLIICLLGLMPCASAADLIRSKVNSGKCLAKTNGNWQNGNPIRLWDCSPEGDITQAWVYNDYNGYIYAETNRDKCFHKAQRGWVNGNRIHIWDCDAGSEEMKTWDLTHQNPFRVRSQHLSRFKNRSTHRCLRIADADNRDGGSVTVSRCRDTGSANLIY